MVFWIISIGLAVAAAAVVAWPLLRREDEAAPRAAHDVQVFRDQLKELDRDVARGVVAEDDAEATKLEISRRLLAADEEMRRTHGAGAAPKAVSRALAAILIVAAPVSAVWLYSDMGAPGAEDLPFASRGDAARPSQEEAERMMAGRAAAPPADSEDVREFETLVRQLEARLAEAPNDEQGVFLYARSLMNLGRFADAWPQFGKLIDLNDGKVEADIYAGYAEGMILATAGYISPEAEDALLEVIKRDPTNPSGRYYLGRLHLQEGDTELAAAVWGRLLEESPPNAPWVAPIRQEMARLELGPRDVAGLAGPTQEDIQAAGTLPPEERNAMVADMVDRLDARLRSDGGTLAEWQQLVRSYSVLGDQTKAREALEMAREAMAGNPAALAELETGGPFGGALPPSQQSAQPSAQPGLGLPPQNALPGPDRDDIANAADMSEGDRAAMINGMVARLEERLRVEGGSVDEWLRLITSLGVMGRSEEAARAYAAAREDFANDPQALATLEATFEGAPRAASPAAPNVAARPGPSQEDVAAAADMAPEDRREMIRGMVDRLHTRLRAEGRPADVNDWGQLMRSYRVLGDQDAIRAAYEEAIQIYDDDAIGLAYLKEAALLNGVTFD